MMLFLSGCSSSPEDLAAKTTPIVQTYAENYQEIYRRVSTTAKRCWAEPISAQAAMVVDAELYSDLGYGEVAVSMVNWGARNYYVTTKIEKAQQGSRLTMRSGNALDDTRANFVLRWAAGDQNCRPNL